MENPGYYTVRISESEIFDVLMAITAHIKYKIICRKVYDGCSSTDKTVDLVYVKNPKKKTL